MVEPVREKNRAYLGDLAAQSEGLAVPENGNKVSGEFAEARVFDLSPQKREKNRMVYAVEKLFEINRQRVAFIKAVALLGFNTPPLGALHTGGAGDLFPRIRKNFKEKSSIPQGLPCGSSLILN
jgi:hypothetical protein